MAALASRRRPSPTTGSSASARSAGAWRPCGPGASPRSSRSAAPRGWHGRSAPAGLPVPPHPLRRTSRAGRSAVGRPRRILDQPFQRVEQRRSSRSRVEHLRSTSCLGHLRRRRTSARAERAHDSATRRRLLVEQHRQPLRARPRASRASAEGAAQPLELVPERIRSDRAVDQRPVRRRAPRAAGGSATRAWCTALGTAPPDLAVSPHQLGDLLGQPPCRTRPAGLPDPRRVGDAARAARHRSRAGSCAGSR